MDNRGARKSSCRRFCLLLSLGGLLGTLSPFPATSSRNNGSISIPFVSAAHADTSQIATSTAPASENPAPIATSPSVPDMMDISALKTPEDIEERKRIVEAAQKAINSRDETVRKAIGSEDDNIENRKLIPPDAVASLLKIYEAMRPRDAAAIFNVMDSHVLIALAASLNIRKLAAIMSFMSPDRVNMVSQYIVGIKHFHHAVPASSPVINTTIVPISEGKPLLPSRQ